MDAAKHEANAWRIIGPPKDLTMKALLEVSGAPPPTYITVDDRRYSDQPVSIGDAPIPDWMIEKTHHKTREAAVMYIEYRVARAIVIHLLCFWRKDPAL